MRPKASHWCLFGFMHPTARGNARESLTQETGVSPDTGCSTLTASAAFQLPYEPPLRDARGERTFPTLRTSSRVALPRESRASGYSRGSRGFLSPSLLGNAGFFIARDIVPAGIVGWVFFRKSIARGDERTRQPRAVAESQTIPSVFADCYGFCADCRRRSVRRPPSPARGRIARRSSLWRSPPYPSRSSAGHY